MIVQAEFQFQIFTHIHSPRNSPQYSNCAWYEYLHLKKLVLSICITDVIVKHSLDSMLDCPPKVELLLIIC